MLRVQSIRYESTPPKVNKKLKELWTQGEINKETYECLRSSFCSTPQMYGLPKIHKPGTPLRPIVSSIGSATYYLAKELTTIISPLVGNTNSYVKDSGDFVQKIKRIQVNDDTLLVSFDVVQLFTKVPIEETLIVIKNKLSGLPTQLTSLRAETVIELLHLYLTSTYFMWNGQIYEQTEGAAMVNPLSPVIANIFMEHFEELAISTFPVKPETWLRYVDDTFVTWKAGKDKLEEFLNHLNSLRSSISFTMELEEDGQLPFLDVLVKRRGGGLSTTVFRKKTHTDRYIHYTSNHHPKTKLGVIKCLKARAEKICNDNHMKGEVKHLKNVFKKNGYPIRIIRTALRNKPTTEEERGEDEEERPTGQPRRNTPCFLPYVKGTSEKVGKICQKFGLYPVFQQHNTLRSLLTRVKDPQKNKDKGIVYRIPCRDCSEVYIGETGRPSKTRITEHRRAVNQMDTKNANAVHSDVLNHRINWDRSKVIDREKRWKERKIKEGIHIRRHRTYNLDSGYPLSPVWDSLIRDIK